MNQFSQNKYNRDELDIVIAWVDGADPVLKQKRAHYQAEKSVASEATTATRFASDDEIYYNIASIIKYVPFCRHIYIVTDEQQPAFIHEFDDQGICAPDKVRIIDHKDIFRGYEQFLPTFNTRSIETMLWNIAGLSDHFIYMNDDFFFNQPVTLNDFLEDKEIIIHGHWRKSGAIQAKISYRKSLQKLFGTPVQPRHTVAQMLSAKILGMNKFFEIPHYPHVVDKHILKDYLLSHPKLLEQQIKYKFRDVAQVNPITLMNHLKIRNNEARLKPDIAINYLKNKNTVDTFINNLHNKSIKYGCIQSLDQLEAESYQSVRAAMIQKLSDFLPTSVAFVQPSNSK
ncbi:capsular polysaccharide biosynthesis protein [uncultured Psychrobacter sp.]|uniref:capsular polysaccharide biosynthesis protein n=1 Tax=uncultured Psychrobacter sp. TaxID=259303 RepID=UPI003459AB0F